MATIKSYTDIEQSRKLAKILPIESADMFWIQIDDDESFDGSWETVFRNSSLIAANDKPLFCWSLAALLSILPTIDDRNAVFCKDIRCDKWHVFYHSTATLPLIDTERYYDVIDACYEMILKLHELNLL